MVIQGEQTEDRIRVVISQEIIKNGKIQGRSWFFEISQGVLNKKFPLD